MANGYPLTEEQMRRNDEAAQAAAQAREEAKERAREGVEHRLSVRDEAVAEFYEREAGLRPTPTQLECDMLRAGAMDFDAEKEPDGSEPQEEGVLRVMTARLPGNNPYETRDMAAGGSSAAPVKRGPGRPRKHPVDEQPA